LLLNFKADPNLFDDADKSPLEFAYKTGGDRAYGKVRKLLEVGADAGAILHAAAHNQDTRTIKLLHRFHADLDAHGPAGTTPLGIAIEDESVLTIKLLLKLGANVNAPELDGYYSPLSIAIRFENFFLVELLVAHKADPNFQSARDRYTPLEEAFCDGEIEMTRLLLQKGDYLDEKQDFIKKALREHAGLQELLQDRQDEENREEEEYFNLLNARDNEEKEARERQEREEKMKAEEEEKKKADAAFADLYNELDLVDDKKVPKASVQTHTNTHSHTLSQTHTHTHTHT
jgi:ankyrin repeat protein